MTPSDPLGLSPTEHAAYELLVDRPGAGLAELEACWSGPEPLADVLTRLEERSLVTPLPSGYRAAEPGVAFDALLADYEDRLERARRHVGTLDAAYRARPSTRDATAVIEVVTGHRAIHQRLLQIQRGARHQVALLAKPPEFVAGSDEHAPLHRGLTCRTIYDRSAIEPPGALSTVEQLIQAGQLARMLPDLPVRLYLADERIAVLPLQRHPAATDAVIVVHPSALLDALIKLFDGLWQRALPLQPPADGESRPAAETQRLITLLLSGLTDEAIAHQLGLSHRTVQRRVAALMSDLGAHTRFQAGMQAALGRTRSKPG